MGCVRPKRNAVLILLNKVDPLDQQMAVALDHGISIQRALLPHHLLDLDNKQAMASQPNSQTSKTGRFSSSDKKLTHSKQSSVVVPELEKLSDVGPSLREPGLAAVPEDREAGDGESGEGLELGGLEGSSQQAVELLAHDDGSTT